MIEDKVLEISRFDTHNTTSTADTNILCGRCQGRNAIKVSIILLFDGAVVCLCILVNEIDDKKINNMANAFICVYNDESKEFILYKLNETIMTSCKI